jgi:hypothetical protein
MYYIFLRACVCVCVFVCLFVCLCVSSWASAWVRVCGCVHRRVDIFICVGACCLIYPTCKAHASYCIVTCGFSGSTTFFDIASNGTIFWVIEHKVYFDFSLKFVPETCFLF